MSYSTVLLAGASGTLGGYICGELLGRSYQVRALQRRPRNLPPGISTFDADLTQPETLRGCCDGIDVVVSCAGARMSLAHFGDRQNFPAVDCQGNENLLTEARQAGVRRFVYVSLAGGPELRQTIYADAHERFVDRLSASGLPFTVVRPTGFFQFFREVFNMVQQGRAFVIGDGSARTNPIDASDVARACAESVSGSLSDWSVGGPDTFTRLEIFKLAADVLQNQVRPRHLSPRFVRALISPLRLLQPRLHALAQFGIEVGLEDVVAPPYGQHRLEHYFRSLLTAKV